MLGRVGFVVAASVAAYVVRKNHFDRLNSKKNSRRSKVELEQHGEENREKPHDSIEIQEIEYVVEEEGEEEEEEDEKVKQISSMIDPVLSHSAFMDEIDSLLPEFEDMLSGEIELPLSHDKFDMESNSEMEGENFVYEMEIANHESEIQRLRNLVKELEEREVKLEGELLEYYGMEEQESDALELQRQLKIKNVEIDMLNITIKNLQAERKKLREEISEGISAKKELEIARNKIKELQTQIQLDTNQTKGHLLMLKQQVISLQEREALAAKKDAEVEQKLKIVKELEVEVVELRRRNKELQHEKRELTVKYDAAQAKVTALSTMTESDVVAKVREEVNNWKHANEDLTKQVEGLQMNRFSEVEELVYLRWVNACLRYELRNYQTPRGRTSARDLSKSLSSRSQEKAKQLMLEYVGSECGQGETDFDGFSSHPSSPSSDDFDNVSIESSSSRFSSISKKPNLIQKLKKWGKNKDDSTVLLSPSRSVGANSPRLSSTNHRSLTSKGPLEALMLRNVGDGVAIMTFGKDEFSIDSPSSDALNNVAASFQLMSKSVEGVMDEKYPAYKDRHKLALEREKAIKEKAEIARSQRFGDGSDLNTGLSRTKVEREKSITLPPKLGQIKEKVNIVRDSSEPSNENKEDSPTISKMKLSHIEKRSPRVPRPPPRSSGSISSAISMIPSPKGVPPPPPGLPSVPPPPPPPSGSLLKGSMTGDKVSRAPELVELYQNLMKREVKKDTTTMISTSSNATDARSNMIGEIENRSSFLLAVKADVETQGDFVQSLAAEVRSASFTNIEDLVSFVNWLDEELSFLVDERAVLKHFDWPEGKADALREAAFEYQDLMKLEKQVSTFVDDPKHSCESALKKMYSLLEKMEQSVYALLRTRDMAISRYRDFGIAVDWLMDSGVVGKIKLASVQLARKYMKRVSSELDVLCGSEKEPNREFLLLQGVRFAFRVHQFAGGFDSESMRAFEELRSRINTQTNTCSIGAEAG